MTPQQFDVEAVRAQFPILNRRINNHELVYLDSAASAQKPQVVLDALMHTYSSSYANVHRGLHTLANEATADMERARATAAKFIGAANNENVIFTKGGTEGLNLVASSFVAPTIRPGDEIVLSVMEHHSNIVPWHFLREHYGATLVWIEVDETGNLDLNQFRRVLGARTKIVAVTHMSNVLGTLNPLEEIISIAHESNVPVVVDGCQGAVHAPVDVTGLDVDFYVCTGHKLYGPSGIGLLYGKPEHLHAMRPYQGGGEMIERVSLEGVTYAPLPYKFEAGTPPIAEAIAMGAALDWISDIGHPAINAHEARLLEHLSSELGKMNDVRIIGQARNKGPLVSFSLGQIHAHDVAAILDQYGVAVRAGTHCAEPLMTHYGITSTCRASLGIYNTHDDIERLIEALGKVRKFF